MLQTEASCDLCHSRTIFFIFKTKQILHRILSKDSGRNKPLQRLEEQPVRCRKSRTGRWGEQDSCECCMPISGKDRNCQRLPTLFRPRLLSDPIEIRIKENQETCATQLYLCSKYFIFSTDEVQGTGKLSENIALKTYSRLVCSNCVVRDFVGTWRTIFFNEKAVCWYGVWNYVTKRRIEYIYT